MSVTQFVRGKVSKSKRRYIDKKNGFDLDLSYIVEKRIIAMGFPSEGMEAQYRNPYSEVIRFLEKYHRDHYKVYNLCSERGYDPIKFHNRVGLYPFDDHNAPPFELLDQFCKDVKAFLDEHEDNVAVIHCKAGKGRTGTVICCYMLFAGLWGSTEESMTFYAAMRTYNKKGVTIPSQIRYIYYYEYFLKRGMPPYRNLLLKKLTFHGVPRVSGVLAFEVITMTKTVIHHQELEKPLVKKKKKKGDEEDAELETITFDCPTNVPCHGDIKIEVTVDKQTLFTFWFNTAFTPAQWHPDAPTVLKVTQSEMDKANKDKQHKVFPKGFHVLLSFDWMLESDRLEQPEVYKKYAMEFAADSESLKALEYKQQSRSAMIRYSDYVASYPSLNNY